MNSGGCFLLVFGLFWSSLTLGFDWHVAQMIRQRFRAESFATAPGRVTHCELVRTRGRKGGTRYTPKIHFTYTVGGREFTSETYHFGDQASNDATGAERIVKAYPVGQTVTVHYDAADPAQAVLLIGLEGGEIFLTLFLTLFNCVMFVLWAIPVFALWRKLSPRPAGVPLTRKFRRTHACLATVTPLGAAVLTLAGTSFAGIFIVGFSCNMNPNLTQAATAWAVVLALALLAAAWCWVWLNAGHADLVLDVGAATLTLPPDGPHKTPVQFSFNEIKGITVERIAHTGSKGGTSYSHAPTLQLANGGSEQIADWYDEPKANQFAAWLRKELNLPEPPPAA